MHQTMIKKLTLFCFSLPALSAYEISDVALKPKDVKKYEVLASQAALWEDGCAISNEVKPNIVSIQTDLLYDKPEMYEQVMGKVEKAHVTLKCKSGSGSIIYLKFPDSKSADSSFGFIKGLIWGEGGRSKRHPERIQKYANIIAIFSSANPGVIDYLQLGKIIYSNVPSETFDRIRSRSNCAKIDTADYCEGLYQIPKYKPVAFPTSFSKGAFAIIWHLKPDKSTNVTYGYAKVQNGKIGIRDVSPDNEQEAKEMTAMMKVAMPPTKEILQFVSTLKLDFAELQTHNGSYRANLGGNVFALYPVGNKIYFVVTAEHFLDEPGTTIIGYFLLP